MITPKAVESLAEALRITGTNSLVTNTDFGAIHLGGMTILDMVKKTDVMREGLDDLDLYAFTRIIYNASIVAASIELSRIIKAPTHLFWKDGVLNVEMAGEGTEENDDQSISD